MKFQKLEAFSKHFKEAYPNHLAPVYIIVAPKESERKKILKTVTSILEPESDWKRCAWIKEAIEHLSGASLLSGKVGALFEDVESLLKAEMEMLIRYVGSPNPKSYLVLGAASAKSISELYKKGKKDLVILDLSLEKPWEEKERLQKWIVQTLAANKKKVSPATVSALLERLPPDRLLLQQEIDKLFCYIGDREEVTQEDIEDICSSSSELNHFQLARELIWEKPKPPPVLGEVSILLPLIGQLRSQLEMGLKMSALLKRGASQEEISKAFPRLWPKALTQSLHGVRTKGEAFFLKGLQALFDLEFGLKTSKSRPDVLFSIFCTECIAITGTR